jgi:von Willebrand factor type A domain
MKNIFAVVGLLLVSVCASASEAWILNIPVRFIANQETGEVRIVMDLNAAPAGAQLVVNGATTLALGATQTINGDSVSFAAGSGNSVRIVYKPLSNFGADFCAGGAAQEKNVPMRFVGAQDIVDYRMSTYIVAAPAAECSQVSKHTGDTPASLLPNDDGVAPALTATFTGRLAFDIALVLDKSGSMADLPPGSNNGPSKADILKSAVQGFVAQWEQVDAPVPGGKDDSTDRLGIVFFDAAPAAQTLPGADPPGNIFLQRGPALAWDAVVNKTNTLSPGSSTSIGAGVNEAMQQWKNDPKNDLSVVVVTDGMQNTAPLISPTNSGFLGLTPVAGFPQELRQRFVPIQTVGFGTPAQVDEDLLRNMSLETAGVSWMTVNATTMFDVFGQTLVAILKGNTASTATRAIDTITGPGPTALRPVLVDSSAERAVFSVQWAPPLRNALDLEVFRPGSTIVATPTAARKLSQIALQRFDKPAPGVWNVRVKRGLDQKPDPVPYTLNVFFRERHLDYQLSFDNLHAGTGEKLGIRALVAWDGKPLAGLPDGSIRVRILRPAEALGTILHDTARRVPTESTTTPAGDIQTPLDVKLASFKGQSLLDRIALKEVAVIALKEEGKGVYSAAFDQTSIPGTYAFEALLDWDTRLTGRIHREERLEENVTAKADPAKTTVAVVQTATPGIWTVTVTPRDRFGNYLGPGYASRIHAKLRSEAGSISEVPVDAKQIGEYVFTARSAIAPNPIVVVDGVVIGGRQ